LIINRVQHSSILLFVIKILPDGDKRMFHPAFNSGSRRAKLIRLPRNAISVVPLSDRGPSARVRDGHEIGADASTRKASAFWRGER
jgi:hypothetical protein